MKTFGELIQELREKKGWSAYALAQKAGLSDQAVHNLERSVRQPAFDTVRRLAAALEVSLEWIDQQMQPIELPEATPGRPRGRPPKAADVPAAPPGTAPARKPAAKRKKKAE